MRMEQARAQVVRHCNLMLERGLTKGTGGNISVIDRQEGLMASSPAAGDDPEMRPEDVALLDLEGRQVEGNYAPSSEWEMHLLCYLRRPDIGAVVHTHSLYATVLACLHQELPPVHYLIGYAGKRVRCAPYHLFGSRQLAQSAAEALGQDNALLLANHGLLSVGSSLPLAFSTAEEIEFVCQIYCHAKSMGEPRLLTDAQIEEALQRFTTYGKAAPAKK